MKIVKKLLILLVLSLLLQVFQFIPSALAYVSGPIQSGGIDDLGGNLVANYATLLRYDASGGSGNDPFFFPAVESHADSGAVPPFFLNALKITVSGTRPDGQAIEGLEFSDQAWLDSPHESGSSWYDVLAVLKDVIIHLYPLGASELLEYGWRSPESKWDYNGTATWAVWHWDLVPAHAVYDKGLQFRFSLHCDPDLQGTYTLKIQYYIDIWRYTPHGYFIRWAEKYIYETVTYYFGQPKLFISASSGGTTDPAPGTYTYNYGSSVTVTASAYSGYTFDYWLLDGATVFENPITVTMDSDHTLEAYFSEPVCAMKTRTDGYFYKPNVATDLLKIEMLFDNQNITGDQIGGTSPYSTITAYPDGLGKINDIVWVQNKFGTKEGDDDWDYMADINADRRITIADIVIAVNCFGHMYTYLKDLSGVTVTFNTGGELSPDSYGFVVIPSGATSFTVKRNSTPIGAMIIFW